nr:hypothetical protein [Tanacetum cinerariifolium]
MMFVLVRVIVAGVEASKISNRFVTERASQKDMRGRRTQICDNIVTNNVLLTRNLDEDLSISSYLHK